VPATCPDLLSDKLCHFLHRFDPLLPEAERRMGVANFKLDSGKLLLLHAHVPNCRPIWIVSGNNFLRTYLGYKTKNLEKSKMRKLLLSAALLVGSTVAAFADTIEVQMLNANDAGDKMVFSQELIRAEVGDVIRFIPTDRSHNAESVKDALPEGQEAFKGKMSSEVEYLVTETGLTAVVCQPHQTMGMVALIVVGNDVSNAQDILDSRVRGQGKDKIKALVEEAIASPS
jgi:pseudoazurin